jgi:hypothetical protein
MLPKRYEKGFPYNLNLDGIPLMLRHARYSGVVGEWLRTKTVQPILIQKMILACCDETDVDIRMTAVFILGAVKDKRAEVVLLKLLSDQDENVRAITAWALGNIPSQKVCEALSKFVESERYPPAFQFAQNSLMNVELFLLFDGDSKEVL